MSSRSTPTWGFIALAISCCFLVQPPSVTAAFTPGHFLISMQGLGIQEFDAQGNLVQTINYWAPDQMDHLGLGLLPDGRVGMTGRPHNWGGFSEPPTTIAFYDSTGAITPYPGPVSGQGFNDINVFSDGTIALTDWYGHICLTKPGVNPTLVTLGSGDSFGGDIAPDNTLWVGGRYSHKLFHVSPDGTVLSTITLASSYVPGDVTVDHSDGSLWLADSAGDRVVHVSTNGTVLSSFPVAMTHANETRGIALDFDGNVLANGYATPEVLRYSRDGQLLQTIALNGSPYLIATVVPEPGCISTIGILLIASIVHRRRW